MAGQFNNPYSSPQFNPGNQNMQSSVKGKVLAPAIFLTVVGSLGILFSIFNCATAMIGEPPPIDPNAPEFLREMQKNAHGPVAVVIQGIFVVVNAVIIFGAVQMMRFQMWPLGLAASILAMVNIGTCCCILGLPGGIWSLVILLQADVKQAFGATPAPQQQQWGQGPQ